MELLAFFLLYFGLTFVWRSVLVYRKTGTIAAMQSPPWATLGWVLMGLSLTLMLVAQAQMGLSWRIGIDEKNRTGLVTNGLFSLSRNPIF